MKIENGMKIQTFLDIILCVGAFVLWMDKISYLSTTFILIVLAVSLICNYRILKFKIDKYTLVIFFYIITLVVNTIFSTDFTKSYIFIKFLISMLLMIVIMKSFNSNVQLVCKTITIMSFLLTLTILWEYINFETFRKFAKMVISEELYIAISTNRSSFGRYVGLGVYSGPASCLIVYGICVAQCYMKKNFKYYVFLLLGILGIFLTGSRTQLLIFFVIMLIYKIMLKPIEEKKITIYKILKYFCIIILSVVLLFLIASELSGKEIRLLSSDASSSQTAYTRFELYKYAFKLFLENPIIGTGINTFLNFSTADNSIESTYTHNLLLQSLAEEGIIGTIALFLIIILSFYYTLINYKNNKNCLEYRMSLLIQIVFIIYSMVGNPFFDINLRMIYMIGIYIGLRSCERRNKYE